MMVMWNALNKKIDKLGARMDKFDEKLTDVDRRLCRIEGAIEKYSKKDLKDFEKWASYGYENLTKDYVRCKVCKNPVSTRRSVAPENMKWIDECEDCSKIKFSSDKFLLAHQGQDKWMIKNHEYEAWCGEEHGWVHLDSSYYHSFPDLYPVLFNWDEVKVFVKENFECIL